MKRRTFIQGSALAGASLLINPAKKLSAMQKNKKVIVLGFDGLDPGLCHEFMGKGLMPNLRTLSENGTFTPLATSLPALSPVAWSSIATGTNPGVHGLYDFIIRDPKTLIPELSIIKHRKARFGFGGGSYEAPVKAEPFWETLNMAGHRCTVIRWPVTYPANAYGSEVLSGLGAPDIRGTLGRYTLFTEEPNDRTPEMRGEAITIAFDGGRSQTAFNGPSVANLGGVKPVSKPIELTRENGNLTIAHDQKTLSLSPGEWSEWQRFDFDLGLIQGKVSGLAKFYLTSLNPLKLYLTPLQVDPKSPCFPILNSDSLTETFNAAFPDGFATLGMPEDTKALSEEAIPDEAFIEMCEEIDSERERMFDLSLKKFDQGLLACVFDTSDRIQHMFWRLRNQASPLYDAELAKKVGPVIARFYTRADTIIGKALSHCGDEYPVLICSDHGFTDYERSVNLNRWLAENGYLSLTPHDPSQQGEGFAFVNWEKTKAYALGFGSIYLNMKDREKHGIVSETDAASLRRQLVNQLETITDPDRSEAQVVRKAYLGADHFNGPQAHLAPDIVVGYAPPYRSSWTTAIGGIGATVLEDNDQKWSGDHCMDPMTVPGILASNRRFRITDIPSQDVIAPTTLSMLGTSPNPGMSQPLQEL